MIIRDEQRQRDGEPEYPYTDIIDGAIGPSRKPLQQIYRKDTAYDDEFLKLGGVSQICTI
jgi:hypothetical protein